MYLFCYDYTSQYNSKKKISDCQNIVLEFLLEKVLKKAYLFVAQDASR